MAFTRGVGPAYNSTSAGNSSVAVTLNSCTAGRSLVITCQWGHGTVTLDSVTISGESNATIVAGSLATHSEPYRVQQAYLANITASGNKTVTATFSSTAAANLSIGVMEYVGGDTSSFVGASNAANGNSGGPTLSLTTTGNNSLIVGSVFATGSQPTAGGAYTLWGTRPDAGWFEEDEDNLNAGAAGAKTVDFSANNNWALSAVEYKLAGGDASAALSGSASTGGSGTGVPGIEIGL